MTPEEFRSIRDLFGLSLRDVAEYLRISDVRTVRRWADGALPISGPASIVLRAWAEGLIPIGWPDMRKGAPGRSQGRSQEEDGL